MRVRTCFDAASDLARAYLWTDRGARNLGGLLITMLPAIPSAENLRLEDLHVDETLLQGVAPPAALLRVTMNQIDVRGADLRDLRFEDTTIVTLIADDSTRVPASMPAPSVIRNEGFSAEGEKIVTAGDQIERWLDGHGRRPVTDLGRSGNAGLVPADLRDHCAIRLLERVCRSRSYWIPERREKGDHGSRFVDEDEWAELLGLLKAHGLVRIEMKASSGRESRFLHIMNRQGLLQGIRNKPDDRKVIAFYHALIKEIAKSE